MLGDAAVAAQVRRVGAETHGAAEIAAVAALLELVALHPLGHQADDGLVRLAELGRARALRCRTGFARPRWWPSACRSRCRNRARCARARTWRRGSCPRSRARRSRPAPGCRRRPRGRGAGSSRSKTSLSIHSRLTLTRLAMPPCTSASISDLVGVLQAGVLADDGDRHLALGRRRCCARSSPSARGRGAARR